MDRFAIAQRLRDIAELLPLEGAPPFRAQAYAKGAAALDAAEDFERLLRERRLTDLAGIGQGLSAVIIELATTGEAAVLNELTARLPPGALELAPILGLEPMKKLFQALGIASLDALEAACAAGEVRKVHGFGEKTEARLLEKIRAQKNKKYELLLADARAVAGEVAAYLTANCPGIDDVVPVGALRRGQELVAHVELLAIGDVSQDELTRVLAVHPRASGETPLTVYLASPADAGDALFDHTGPAEHVAAVRERLLPPSQGAAPRPRRARPSEDDVYRDAGMAPIPPELRDAPELADTLLADLITAPDIQGFVHCHTTWSDGRNSVAEMAQAAAARGLRYLTITDHSQTASYANGLDEARLLAQWDEIDRVQATTRLRLLKGIESDILADGALDFPDAILARLDVVIASIHARNAQAAPDMTKRLVAMMRHPLKKVWGHPLGRMLQRRAPIDCDLELVLETAAETGTILELNGDPHRMDLPVELARKARALGIRFVASVDAHATAQLGYLDNAITLARRSALTPAHVLNTLPVDEFMRAVRPTA